MSPEEYRAKLQETISARQAKRREESLRSRDGVIGNRSSSNYLDRLGRGGAQGEQIEGRQTETYSFASEIKHRVADASK